MQIPPPEGVRDDSVLAGVGDNCERRGGREFGIAFVVDATWRQGKGAGWQPALREI
jgi:hypothetical protein